MRFLPSRQKGFVLVATIWLLAILALAAGTFALWVERALERAQQGSNETQGAIDIAATRATLFYLLSTNSMSQAGLTLPSANKPAAMSIDEFISGRVVDDMGGVGVTIDGNEMRLDGTVYKGVGSARFAIYDTAGLITVNASRREQIIRLMNLLGYDDRLGGQMSDRLLDYIDSDDLRRADGAERFHYRQRGLPGPSNGLLLSRFELAQVLGWSNIEGLWEHDGLASILTAEIHPSINLNAVPRQAAMVAFALTSDQADKLLEVRAQQPFESLSDAIRRTELPLGSYYDLMTAYPSTKLRVHLWHKGSRLERQLGIRLAALADLPAPWLISRDFTLRITEHYVDQEPSQLQHQLFP